LSAAHATEGAEEGAGEKDLVTMKLVARKRLPKEKVARRKW